MLLVPCLRFYATSSLFRNSVISGIFLVFCDCAWQGYMQRYYSHLSCSPFLFFFSLKSAVDWYGICIPELEVKLLP